MTDEPSTPIVRLWGTRRVLDARRLTDTIKIKSRRLGGRSLYIGLHSFEEGTLAEAFLTGAKAGSQMDAMLREFATMLSLALQYGMPISAIKGVAQRETNGDPETAFGEAIDALLIEYETRQG